MGFTPGEIYFYSGITGIVVSVTFFIVNIIIIAKKKKKLAKLLTEEYGEGIR